MPPGRRSETLLHHAQGGFVGPHVCARRWSAFIPAPTCGRCRRRTWPVGCRGSRQGRRPIRRYNREQSAQLHLCCVECCGRASGAAARTRDRHHRTVATRLHDTFHATRSDQADSRVCRCDAGRGSSFQADRGGSRCSLIASLLCAFVAMAGAGCWRITGSRSTHCALAADWSCCYRRYRRRSAKVQSKRQNAVSTNATQLAASPVCRSGHRSAGRRRRTAAFHVAGAVLSGNAGVRWRSAWESS